MSDMEPSPPAIANATMAPGGAIAALVPQSLDDAFRLSKALAVSGDMVPKHFQSKPEMIMAAIVRGMEIGLAPMQALSNIAVINGRASIWGDALPALLQRAGHSLDSWIEGEGDQMVAVAEVTRGDTGKVYRRTFSVADAKAAGLLGKAGPWQQYRSRMLQMRARSFAARDGAADALMGLQVAEEMQDVPMRDVTPKEAPRGPNLAQRLQSPPVEIPEPHWTEGVAWDGAFPVSDEWQAGVDAFGEGKPATDCPYDADMDKAINWLGGWHGARGAKE
jgi:ribosome modulation factor